MKLSVITPSYNQGQFIERTLCSVLDQSVEDLEYWVIDGGSTDETLAVLQKYEGRLQWVSEPDNGQTDALNKGLGRTSGEIIGWLNSDDIYYPGVLQQVLRFFADHPEVKILYGRGNHIDTEDGVIEPYPTREWDYQALLDDCFICQPAVFFRREIFEQYGLFNESLNFCMDYEYWLRVGRQEPIYYYPELLAGSRLYDENKTLGCRRQVREEILAMVSDKMGKLSLRWLTILGICITEEKGLRRRGPLEKIRFAAHLFRCISREAAQRGQPLTAEQIAALSRWWLVELSGRFSRYYRRLL
jgi:glycosyltransferase involved in cell wall biosynthesis